MSTVQLDYSGNLDTFKNCKTYIEYICSIALSKHFYEFVLLLLFFIACQFLYRHKIGPKRYFNYVYKMILQCLKDFSNTLLQFECLNLILNTQLYLLHWFFFLRREVLQEVLEAYSHSLPEIARKMGTLHTRSKFTITYSKALRYAVQKSADLIVTLFLNWLKKFEVHNLI